MECGIHHKFKHSGIYLLKGHRAVISIYQAFCVYQMLFLGLWAHEFLFLTLLCETGA